MVRGMPELVHVIYISGARSTLRGGRFRSPSNHVNRVKAAGGNDAENDFGVISTGTHILAVIMAVHES